MNNRCRWHYDKSVPGGRFLVPGCWSRAVYGDNADCRCLAPKAAEARLAEAVEVMRSCRATYVENDDASALERTISNIDDFLAKLEGGS